MGRVINFSTDLLRTFVSIVDLGSFTKAGNALGRTQPAISLQMKRLEDLVGRPLLRQEGRSFQLTPDGEMLLGYARDILRLNDHAAAFFNNARRTGRCASACRATTPSAFPGRHHRLCPAPPRGRPRNPLQPQHCPARADARRQSRPRDRDGRPDRDQYLSCSWIERPIWSSVDDAHIDVGAGLQIAAHPEGCIYRARMIRALDAARIRWRISHTSPGISGLQNAVLNGLGISALTRHTLLPGMRVLGPDDGLPSLDDIRVGLLYKHPRLSSAGIELINHIIARLDEAGTSGDRPASPANCTDCSPSISECNGTIYLINFPNHELGICFSNRVEKCRCQT